ncbi:Nin one binding Zn-ribbon like-domain-containing protein, partial [Geopyxis carbonaria]
LVLDAGPILSSAAAPSTYLTAADRIYTTPSVVAEIRDEAARSRFETLWKPFVNVRSPKPASVKAVADFSKRTGDYQVLSATDLGLAALAWELEIEVAGGEWRMRKVPGQNLTGPLPEGNEKPVAEKVEQEADAGADIAQKLKEVRFETLEAEPEFIQPEVTEDASDSENQEDDDDDDWITPSNIQKHKTATSAPPASSTEFTHKLPVAIATVDFALQNVLLQLNLSLLSPMDLVRIQSVRSTALRCHACFFIVRHPSTKAPSDFCPRCGGLKTLLRVSCSTDSNGLFKVHLKRNFQYNNRGNVFSLPKTRHGTSSMKGVPDNPVLREDQKEYTRAVKWEGWRKEKDMLDPDHLPNILTGERREGNRIRTGTGRRNPNEPKRGGGKRKK